MAENTDKSHSIDLAHRRERGRLAQRAFRQRQIDTIRALNEENQELKDAIARISKAAASNLSSMTDPDLQAAIQYARQVAKQDAKTGILVSGAGHHISDNDDHYPRHIRPTGSSESPRTTLSDTGTIDPSEITGPHHHHLFPASHSSDDTNLEELPDWHTSPVLSHSLPQHAAPFSSQPQISPRLTYGLLLPPASSPTPKMTNPPPDIAAYLGPASHTFSGTLFWSALSYAYRAVRAAIRLPSPSPGPSLLCQPPPPIISNAHLPAVPSHLAEHADAVFASALRHTSLARLHDLLHARLLFGRQGWVPADHPAARDPDAWIRLNALILRHDDVDIADWWAPADVDAYVRVRGAEPAVVIGTLVNKGRCFGDGPRWSADLVREVVGAVSAAAV